MAYKILLADDEANITDVCERYLVREGYEVIIARNGVEAVEHWRVEQPDLVVLDIMMPIKDGWEAAEEIRETSDVPIIMLTALGQEKDKILGLTIGADDYMTKPFSPRELVLRVKNILRRAVSVKPEKVEPTKRLVFEHLVIDATQRYVEQHGEQLDLTMKEFDLLWLLASYPNQVFSRSQLLEKIWGYDFFGDGNTVNVHIRRLREKLEENPANPVIIKTVWGIGYKFEGELTS